MRATKLWIILLLGLMCAVRAGLGLAGYIAPDWVMGSFGIDPAANPNMAYVVRVWAIRDIVIAGLVVTTLVLGWLDRRLAILVIGCIAIELGDVLSAGLAAASPAYDAAQGVELASTAILALVPETLALLLLRRLRRGETSAPAGA